MAVFPIDNGPDFASNATSQMSPKLYAPILNIELYKSTFLPQIANTQYQGQISKQGDSVAIRGYPDITIFNTAIGQKIPWQKPDPSSQTLLIDKGKGYAFTDDDVQLKQSDIGYVQLWMAHAAKKMAIQIDADVLGNVFNDVHASNQGATAGAESASYNMGVAAAPFGLTTANIVSFIVKAGAVLDEQNVVSENRYMVIPVWMAALIKQSDLKDASLAGDNTSIARNGRLGMIDRFTLFVSNNLLKTADSGGETATNIFFGHKQGLTFAQQITMAETVRLIDYFGNGHRGQSVYGYKIQKPESCGWGYVYDAT